MKHKLELPKKPKHTQLELDNDNIPDPIRELIDDGIVETVVCTDPLTYIVKFKSANSDKFDRYETFHFVKKT